MDRRWRKQWMAIALAAAVAFGGMPSYAKAADKPNHGTTTSYVSIDKVNNTPPAFPEYDVNPDTQGKAKEGKYNKFFLKDKLQTVKIKVNENNLNWLLQNAADKPTVMAESATIGDTTVKYVGLKTKGNFTLARTCESKSDRFSFTINFGKYVKKKNGYSQTQDFYGCNKISFNNFFFDKSMMNEYCAMRLMTEMGVPTSQYGLARLYINDRYYGVYFMLEAMDTSIVKQYMNKKTGTASGVTDFLTKPSYTALQYDSVFDSFLGPDGTFTAESLAGAGLMTGSDGKLSVKENSVISQLAPMWENDQDTFDDVSEWIPTALTWERRLSMLCSGRDFEGRQIGVNTQKYRELVESVMDVDEALRYFAAHSFVVQMDNMFTWEQNYGLYMGADGRSLFVPWDYDLAWGCDGTPNDAETLATWNIDTMFNDVNWFKDISWVDYPEEFYQNYPMFGVLYQNNIFRQQYHRYMEDCARLTSLGGKTSDGETYDTCRYAKTIKQLTKEIEKACEEPLADNVYYLNSANDKDFFRGGNQPADMKAALPNLARLIARRAVGVMAQTRQLPVGIICGADCNLRTVCENCQKGNWSESGYLTTVDEETGIFVSAGYTKTGVSPSLTGSRVNTDDAVFQKIKQELGCQAESELAVYLINSSRKADSAYRVYVPAEESLVAADTGLYVYSETSGVQKVDTTVYGHLYSGCIPSLGYVVVAKSVRADGLEIVGQNPEIYEKEVTGTGDVWDGVNGKSRNYTLRPDGSLELYVKAEELNEDDFGFFCIEFKSSDNSGDYYLTTASDRNAWFAGEAKGDIHGIPNNEYNRFSALTKGHVYKINIMRSGKDITVQYYDMTTNTEYRSFQCTNTNMPEDVPVYLLANVGKYELSGRPLESNVTDAGNDDNNNNNNNNNDDEDNNNGDSDSPDKKTTITVKKGNQKVSKVTVKRGSKVTLKVTVSPKKSKLSLAKLSAANKKIISAKLKENGNLTIEGRKKGKVTLQLKSGKTTKKIQVTVKK